MGGAFSNNALCLTPNCTAFLRCPCWLKGSQPAPLKSRLRFQLQTELAPGGVQWTSASLVLMAPSDVSVRPEVPRLAPGPRALEACALPLRSLTTQLIIPP